MNENENENENEQSHAGFESSKVPSKQAGSHQFEGNQSRVSMAGKNVGLARADPSCASRADCMQGYFKISGQPVKPYFFKFTYLNMVKVSEQ